LYHALKALPNPKKHLHFASDRRAGVALSIEKVLSGIEHVLSLIHI